MSNLQPLLSGGNGVASDLQIVLSESSGSVLVMLGTSVLERVSCSRDSLQHKMLVGRLLNAGWSLSMLQHAFSHDPRTMKKWAAALLSEDLDFVVGAFGGRGSGGKLTPAAVRYVKRRYAELRYVTRNYRQVIRTDVMEYFDVRLSGETLRLLFREADREDACSNAGKVLTFPDSTTANMATGCVSDVDCEFKYDDPTRNQSTISPCETTAPFYKVLATSARVGLHHAGMVLFALLLELFCRRRPWSAGLQTQWLGQILQGAVNIEQSRLISHEDLAMFTGAVVAGTNEQRRALDKMACLETVMDIYTANARLLDDGPGRDRVFYYDPHSKEYTGGLHVLKDWCGRRHGVAKVMHLDMIHTRSGRPCFVQHYSPYYDLRERFFMTLELFDRLFPEAQRQGRLFILDRGIYGLGVFARFEKDDVLTWEKDYRGDGWEGCQPDVVFNRCRTRNRAADLKLYHFECREEPWRRNPRIRRILVRAINHRRRTILVSILCSDPHIPIEEAVWLMFNRWLQENDFKYLDRHFGLNQLTSYASKAVAEVAGQLRDMPVDCPEYRELKRGLRKVENCLAGELLKRERNIDRSRIATDRRNDLDSQYRKLIAQMEARLRLLHSTAADRITPKIIEQNAELRNAVGSCKKQRRKIRRELEQFQRQRQKIELRISPLKQQLEQFDRQLSEAVRQQSRLQLLIDNHYRFLDSRRKETMDALRITASNMFASLVAVFRPIYGNYRNDHVMLRNLTRADGFVDNFNGTTRIQLWLTGRFQQWQTRAFKTFLAEITDRINDWLPPTTAPVRITLLDKPPTW